MAVMGNIVRIRFAAEILYHPEKHDKWCRVVYTVWVLEQGEELTCEYGNFEHTGLLCCHAAKVLDFLGIDKIRGGRKMQEIYTTTTLGTTTERPDFG